MSDFRRLVVWQKAHALALQTYAFTSGFPKEERYGLVSQLRRAATSVGSNLAEGCGRETPREMAYLTRIALGSIQELQYQLLLSKDLGWIETADFQPIEASANEVRAMLHALHRSLRQQ
jgi:four helix bundle protein